MLSDTRCNFTKPSTADKLQAVPKLAVLPICWFASSLADLRNLAINLQSALV
jgi:hypothetical protein